MRSMCASKTTSQRLLPVLQALFVLAVLGAQTVYAALTVAVTAAPSSAASTYFTDGSITYLHAGATVAYTVDISNDATTTAFNNLVIKADGSAVTCDNSPSLSLLDLNSTVQCTFSVTTPAGDFTDASSSLPSLAVAVWADEDSTAAVGTTTLTRSDMRLYSPSFSVAISGCTPAPTAPGSTLTCAGGITVNNTGTLPLTDFIFTATPGIVSSCSLSTLTAAGDAGATTTCTLQQDATFEDFESAAMALSVSATAKDGTAAAATVTAATATSSVVLSPTKTLSISMERVSPSGTINAAGTPVQFKAAVVNTGYVKWNASAALVFDPPLALSCASAASEAIADPAAGDFVTDHVLLAGHKVECDGNYTFTQAVFEGLTAASGPVPFQVSLPSGSLPAEWTATAVSAGAAQTFDKVDVTTAVSASLTGVFGNCTKPTNASSGIPVVCDVQLQNTGNVGLSSLSDSVDASRLTCSPTGTLNVGQTRSCRLSQPVNQDAFDAGHVLLSAADITATADSAVAGGVAVTGPVNSLDVPLDQRPALAVQLASLNPAASITDGGATVTATVSVGNIGNTRVSSISLSSDIWGSFACTGGSNSPPHIASLDPGAVVSCTAEFTFTQDVFEGIALTATTGTLVSAINASATALAVPVEAVIEVQTVYSASLAVNIGGCTLPSAPGAIECDVSVLNTGTARLKGVQVLGPENNCSAIAVLSPGQNVSTGCTVHLSVNQSHFDARELDGSNTLTLVVHTLAMSNITGASIASPPSDAITGLSLPVERLFTASGGVDVAVVDATGQSATHTVIIVNTGNVRLRAVTITSTLQTALGGTSRTNSAYTCSLTAGTPSSLPPSSQDLPEGGSLSCTATYPFASISMIEDGTLSIDTVVAAAAVSSSTLAQATVTVPHKPAFSMTFTDAACDAIAPSPSNYAVTLSARGAVTLSAAGSNVRLNISTLDGLGGATLSNCTAAAAAVVLDPTAAGHMLVCDITSPVLQQGDYEAGCLEYGVAALVSAHGSNATLDGNHSLVFHRTLTQQRSYRLGVKRVAYDVHDTQGSIVTASTPVGLQLLLENLGNTILASTTVALPAATGLVCKSGASSSDDATVIASGTAFADGADVSPRSKVVCTGSFTFNQLELDVDQSAKVFTPATTTTTSGVSVDNSGLSGAGSYAASVTIPIASTAKLFLSVFAGACTIPSIIPADADNVTIACPMSLANTGELTLTDVQAVVGGALSTDCGSTATLAPGGTVNCTLTATAVQDDFDAGTLALAVNTAAGHLGSAARTLDDTRSYSSAISLNHSATMDLVVQGHGAVTRAGDTVSYTVTAINTGAVQLHNLSIVIPAWATVTNCSAALPGPPWVLRPHQSVACDASYTFSQDFYEAGTLSFAASARPAELNATVQSAPATITPGYTPSLAVHIGTCSIPAAAPGAIQCDVSVLNTGTVRLKGVRVLGPENNCSAIAVLSPGQNVSTGCTVHLSVNQSHFDAREADGSAATTLGLEVDAVAVANVTNSTTNTVVPVDIAVPADAVSGLALPVLRDIVVNASLNKVTVNKTGQAVAYTAVIRNTGNVALRGVDITSSLTTAGSVPVTTNFGAYSCSLNGAGALSLPAGLPAGGVLSCTASYTFADVVTIEAGDLTFAATVSASDLSPARAPAALTVTVVQAPRVSMSLNATVCSAPDTADGTMSCPDAFVFTNEGNVRASFTSVTSTTAAQATAGCSASDLLPGDMVLCSVDQPMNQDFLEAGVATISVSAGGITARGSVTLPATVAHTIQPAVTQHKAVDVVLARTDALGVITANGTVVSVAVNITNLSNVRLRGVTWTPSWAPAASVWSACTLQATDGTLLSAAYVPAADVPVGAQVSCEGTYTITQDILEEGAAKMLSLAVASVVTDSLSALAATPQSISIPVLIQPRVTVDVLDTGCTTPYKAGSPAFCPVVISNFGTVRVDNVTVLGDANNCSSTAALRPNETRWCWMHKTLVQQDYEAGFFTIHAANVTGVARGPTPLPHDAADVANTAYPVLTQVPALNLALAANASTVNKAGNGVAYTIRATNTGNIRLYALAATAATTDLLTNASVTCNSTSPYLEVDGLMVCTGSYKFTQDVFEAGARNLTAIYTSPNITGDVLSNMVSTIPIEAPSVAISIQLGTCTTPADAGGDVQCQLALNNSGNVGLANLTVPGQEVGCPSLAYLAPGASASCSMTRSVSQPDFDGWDANSTRVSLAAEVDAQPTGLVSTPLTGQANGTVALVSRPSFSVTSVAASPDLVWTPGTPVTYDFAVHNDGNVALRQLAFGGLDLTGINCTLGNPAFLPVGADVSCTGVFVFTQDKVELGDAAHKTRASSVNLVVPGSGTFGQDVSLAAVQVPNDPALEAFIDITSCNMPAMEPAHLVCACKVLNQGNVRLANVSIRGDVNCSIPAGTTLLPQESLNCTVDRPTVQDDYERGWRGLNIQGCASPRGVNASIAGLQPTAAANISIDQIPIMEVSIETVGNVSSVSWAGTNVSFVVTAWNKGNLILQDTALTAPELGALTCTQHVAVPVRGSLQCTAQSNFDQDDMENGHQTFHAWGESPTLSAGNNVSAVPPKLVQVLESPQLVVDVMAGLCTKPARMPGNATCPVMIKNTGNVRLANISVDGDLNDCLFSLLWPLTNVTCSMTRALTQEEYEAGQAAIVATAVSATPLGIQRPTMDSPAPSDTAKVALLSQVPLLDVTLTTDKGFVGAAGDTVTYTITSINTGSLRLRNITWDTPTVPTLFCTSGGAPFNASMTLELNGQVVCTGSYTFTQDDIEAPPKTITATSLANSAKGAQAFTSNTAVVTPLNAPAMNVDIQTAQCLRPSRAPETLTCPVRITNQGNVRLTAVSIRDQPACFASVIPPAGGVYTCNTTLVSNQDQFEAAHMVVTFVADALPRGANTTLAPSDVTDTDMVLLDTLRKLTITAMAQPNTTLYAGSRINYTFVISNPGNVMVYNTTLVVPGVGPLACDQGGNGTLPIRNMTVYKQVTCRGSFTFDQPTIELGDKTVSAAVTANALTEAAVVPAVVVTVPNVPTLAVSVVTNSCSIPAAAGGIVACNITVLNTGNTRFGSISVAGDAISCGISSPALLSPGANLSCTLQRVTVQDDFELGSVDLLFPLNAIALGTVAALQPPLPLGVYTVRLPQRPQLEVVTSVAPPYVLWPGDTAGYQVSLINRGNVHLQGLNATAVTNSSTTGMQSRPMLDCGPGVPMPARLLVSNTLTCTSTLLFTTPVIRAGNMTIRVTANATNLPAPALGLPLVVQTPTCENRSTPIPAGQCLNVSLHCPNSIDYLCDKTDLTKQWCTCWGGVTECVTLGSCKYTPCKTCQVCLSWAAQQLPALRNMTNAGLVAAEVNNRCKLWGRTSSTCQAAADAIAVSVAGNSGKRGGLLCSLLNECINPAGFETTCNLGNTSVTAESSALVPKGNFSLCSAQGTNKGSILPGGMVVAAGSPLAAGTCRVTSDCNSTDLMCSYAGTTITRCVCDEATGLDSCETLGMCAPTPCLICKRCFTSMRTLAASQQAETNATAVAAAFRAACVAGGRTRETCSLLANKVDASYQGSAGKRPALLCDWLSECTPDLDSSCMLVANTTGLEAPVMATDVDTCSFNGVAGGPPVPGIFASGAGVPDGSCTAAAPCLVDGFRCNYAAGAKFCQCAGGQDTCTPLGNCFETSCTTCQDCLTKVNAFVSTQLQTQNPALLSAAWASFCTKNLPRASAADCQAAAGTIATSMGGFVGKRAATLCSWVKACASDMGSCQLNAAVSGVPFTAPIDMCTVEGVTGGNRVPGLAVALPAGSCYQDRDCTNLDLRCDVTTTTGAVCVCDAASGLDACTPWSPCVKTPCRVCSDCLTQMAGFTAAQLHNQNSSDIAAAFSTYCAGLGTWPLAACSSAASGIRTSQPSYGKRAAGLCQALGVCGAPGALPLGPGCSLKVSLAGSDTQPASSLASPTLDLCAVEGVASGSDVPGTTRNFALPTGTCDSSDDCTAVDPETLCVKTQQTALCICSEGVETCKVIGGCVDTPCKSCKRCLQDFAAFTRTAPAASDALADAFGTFCTSTGRRQAVCDSARLGITSSFRGNAGRRSGAICALLSECTTQASGCSVNDGAIAGNFSLCTREGVSSGTAVAGFAIDTISRPAGSCLVDADCNTPGWFCSSTDTTPSCSCSTATGLDTCSALGRCMLTPCSRCQQCLTRMQDAIRLQLAPGSFTPTALSVASNFRAACTIFAPTAGYDPMTACPYIATQYMLTGASPYFGLRAAALCASLKQCGSLPASCLLRTTVAAPLANVTGSLDMCTAEGIIGGSSLSGVVTVADPPGLCLTDGVCGATAQCDTMNKTQVLRCNGGLDSSSSYGRCIAKPPPAPVVSACDRCTSCLTAARVLVTATFANTNATASALADTVYTWCSARGYGLAGCRSVQAAVAGSFNGNLGRRAGALCLRLGECSAAVAADASCQPTLATAGNATTVKGQVEACTVEGVTGGRQVSGTYAGAGMPSNTCVLDSDCGAGQLCSSDKPLSVCRCMGGVDGCDDLNTCQPTPVPAPAAAPAPVVVLSPCESCIACIKGIQGFVAGQWGGRDASLQAASFLAACTSSFRPGDVLGCRNTSAAIAYSLEGNLAKRAGALCARLGNCSAEVLPGGSGYAACSLTMAGLPVGRPDLCTLEGVSGGTSLTAAASSGLSYGTCLSDKDCASSSSPICSMATPSTRCTCSGGVDACMQLGQCVDFCSTKANQIAQANALVLDCDPTVASRQCPTGLECKASTACKKLACDAAGVRARQCYGLCLPAERTMVAAQLSDDARSIKVVLNAAAAPGGWACLSAFNVTTAKIGTDAWCTVSGRELTIRLGTAAALVPDQDSLALLPAQTQLYDVLDPAAKFTGSRSVSMCSSCSTPEASLNGPSVVPEPCNAAASANIQFDASFSRDPSGRPLRSWQWVQIGTSDVVLAGAVTAANAANNGAGAVRLVLAGSDLQNMGNQAYTLQVTVVNFLGVSNTASLTFTKQQAAAAPVVSIAGGTTQSFRISDGVKLSAQLMASSVCSGKKVEYTWESLDGWSGVPAGYTRKDLVVRPPLSGIMAGDSKPVRLTARFKGSDRASTVDVTLVALGTPLQAVLRGPSGSIRGDRTIVLNASASMDPDDPSGNAPMTVTWECVRADYPVPCFAGTQYGEQQGLVWSLRAALLAPGIAHTFAVTVSKGAGDAARSASASLTLTPLAAESRVPTGRIVRQCGGGCGARHDADAPLALSVVRDASAAGASITWQSDQLAGLSLGSGPDLTVPAASLPATGSLTVSATLQLATGESSTTSVTVPLNGRPACGAAGGTGCLKLTPATTTFPGASWTAEATGFTDDQDGLRYDFGTINSANRRNMLASGAAPTTTFSGLPLGTTQVYVCAVDSSGAQACEQSSVTVQAPPSDFKVTDVLSSFDVSQLAGTGDVAVMAAGAQALSSLSNYAKSAAADSGQSSDDAKKIDTAFAAKGGALINTLAGNAPALIDDPQALHQVVAAVATVGKLIPQPSVEAKTKMLSVVDSAVTAAKVGSQGFKADQATRMMAVLVAASQLKPAATTSGAASSGARRHLLEVQGHQQQQQQRQHHHQHQQAANTSSYWDGSNGSRYDLFGRHLLANSSDTTPAGPAVYVAPAFLATAAQITQLLAASASGSGFLSGGDRGLYVSVANQLGRSYATSAVAAGPALETAGGAADASSGNNAVVQFIRELTGGCVAEDGSVNASTACSDVAVPVALTFLSDAAPLLSMSTTRSAGAAALPADFTIVSGAAILSVGGAASGALPCTGGCAALLTLPLSEAASAKYSYLCAHVVSGQTYLDTAVPQAGSATRSVAGSDSGSVLDCSVGEAGTYVAARTLRPSTGSPQGVADAGAAPAAAAGQSSQSAGPSVPAIVGGVVGGVAGAALVAAVGLLLLKRRHSQTVVPTRAINVAGCSTDGGSRPVSGVAVEDDFSVTLPPQSDDEAGEPGDGTPLQWARIRDEQIRRSREGASPRRSIGASPPHSAGAAASRGHSSQQVRQHEADEAQQQQQQQEEGEPQPRRSSVGMRVSREGARIEPEGGRQPHRLSQLGSAPAAGQLPETRELEEAPPVQAWDE